MFFSYLIRFFIVSITLILMNPAFAQLGSLKKVTVVVTDAVTGKPVEGAEVLYKGLLSKQRKKTDANGTALFEIYIIATSVQVSFDIKSTNPLKPYKSTFTTATLYQTQEAYSVATTVQPENRQLQFQFTDITKNLLPDATITLRDDKGNEVKGITNENGVVIFDIKHGSFENDNITVVIEKKGYEKYIMPASIANSKEGIVINAPIQKTETTKPDLLLPTTNLITTALPANYKPRYTVAPVWGPYKPSCTNNPIADVPEFSSIFVSDEKDLLDYIAESCIYTATDAITSIINLGFTLDTVKSKLTSVWHTESAKAFAQSTKDGKKVIEDNTERLKAAATDALKKTKDAFEKMQALSGGPQLYAASCIWDGIKSYGVDQLPPELQKIKKAIEGFGKAKEAMTEKLSGLKKLAESGTIKPQSMEELKLYTDWDNIKEGVQDCAEGLGVLVAFVKNPIKVLPYEAQLIYALNTIEQKMSTLMTDCKIRECDNHLKDGLTAGQEALTASRKKYAQMRKNEYKWKEKIYQQVKHYNWEHVNFDPGIPGWDTWKKYQKERIKAENKNKELEDMLTKLAAYCTKLQGISVTLNERITKYETMYRKGLEAVSNCKFTEAESFVKQLESLENSSCSDFFPRPYGQTKSDELKSAIGKAKQSGKCDEPVAKGAFVLTGVELAPSNDYFKISETEYKYISPKGGLTYTMQGSPPKALNPGTKFSIGFSATYTQNPAVLDYSTYIRWKNEKEKWTTYGNANGFIIVGPYEGKTINNANGTIQFSAPEPPKDVSKFTLSIGIAAAGGLSTYRWVNYIYERK